MARTQENEIEKFKVGPGIAPGCGGIAFVGRRALTWQLKRVFSMRLRPLRWTVDGTKVASGDALKMTLTLEKPERIN